LEEEEEESFCRLVLWEMARQLSGISMMASLLAL
jgi:hypothetical protein